MAKKSVAAVQRGVKLADVVAPRRRRTRGAATARAAAKRPRGALASLKGPFLARGALTAAERTRLIDGIKRILEGVFAHLPLKRARYGFDPVQRLCILQTEAGELSDDAFHFELSDIVTGLRDAHTRYAGPETLEDKVAALPFLVEMIGSFEAPTYVVTKIGRGLDPSFKPGVAIEYWNGVPIDLAVLRHSEREVGGRPDTQRAWAVQSLTLRSLQYGAPPDEHWVTIGYRTASGQAKEITIDWRVIDPSELAPELSEGPTGSRAKALRRTRAVDPAAEAVRRAKMLLFAPHALTGRQARAPKQAPTTARRKRYTSTIIRTNLTKTLKAMSIDAPGGPFGYLRIFGFDDLPERYLPELLRLLPRFPDHGLIIDVRGNPGGYIWAAEMSLQFFTPNHIEPTRFSALATPFMREIAAIGDVAEDLAPWKPSLAAAVRNGELYAQPLPITDPEQCNALGQQYGGPVVLVADSTTYSSGDLFSAGFVDNEIGPFICVGTATGAGGANVWEYGELRRALIGSSAELPILPDGIDMTFAFRRATRTGANDGVPIEDVGVQGARYAMTENDLLHDNQDLLAACMSALRQLPFSRLSSSIDRRARTVKVTTTGLDRVDPFFDGHSGASQAIGDVGTITIAYPAGTKLVELTAYAGDQIRQRRRIQVRG
jgi:hypothetical protein